MAIVDARFVFSRLRVEANWCNELSLRRLPVPSKSSGSSWSGSLRLRAPMPLRAEGESAVWRFARLSVLRAGAGDNGVAFNGGESGGGIDP